MIVKKFLKLKFVCKVIFILFEEVVEGVKKVVLVGDFNNWDIVEGIVMKKQKGVFKIIFDLEIGKEYEFCYLLDGEIWENDWEVDKYVVIFFGVDNSVVSILN